MRPNLDQRNSLPGVYSVVDDFAEVAQDFLKLVPHKLAPEGIVLALY
jgi:hypothetical protein